MKIETSQKIQELVNQIPFHRLVANFYGSPYSLVIMAVGNVDDKRGSVACNEGVQEGFKLAKKLQRKLKQNNKSKVYYATAKIDGGRDNHFYFVGTQDEIMAKLTKLAVDPFE